MSGRRRIIGRRWLWLGGILLVVSLSRLSSREPPWTARVIRTSDLTWEDARRAGVARGASIPEAFSPDGGVLVISDAGKATLSETATGETRAAWAMPGGRTIYQAIVTPDATILAAQTWDGASRHLTLDLVEMASGKARTSLDLPGGGVLNGGLALGADGRTLRVLVYDDQGDLVLHDVDARSGQVVASRALPYASSRSGSRVTSDGQRLAFTPRATRPGVSPTAVAIHELRSDREIARRPGTTEVTAVALSPDGKLLGVARQPGSIEVWELAADRLRTMIHPHSAGCEPWRLLFSPDGGQVASIGLVVPNLLSLGGVRSGIDRLRGRATRPDFELVVVETATGTPLLRTMQERSPCFSPDGRFLATSHDDGSIRLRELPGRK